MKLSARFTCVDISLSVYFHTTYMSEAGQLHVNDVKY
jgi:hypothetical protein